MTNVFMFAVLDFMPYVLAWPLNEQFDGCCLENMEQSGLCTDFLQQRKNGGGESTWFLRSRSSSRHKAILRNALIVSDHSRFFPVAAVLFFWDPYAHEWRVGGCFPFLIKELRGSSAKAALAAGWYSKGHSNMLLFKGCSCEGNGAVPCLCLGP